MAYSVKVESDAETLRSKAAVCVNLAQESSDDEVSRVLRELANDSESAIPIIEEHERRSARD